jgi:F-type H+-transporting ATPase subunit b
LAQKKATEKLHEAKAQAALIVEQANKRAVQIVDEAKEQATVEGERIFIAAKAEVEQESNRAKEELRGQVAALALAGAEKILGQTIDMKAHNQLVSKLAADL